MKSDSIKSKLSARTIRSLEDVRGKVMFALDNGGAMRDLYLSGHPSLKGRILFASVEETQPAAAFMKINE